MDDLDDQVKLINHMLNEYVNLSDDTYITRNTNLRDKDFYYDNKHLKESCIARFAANIKRALRAAYGIQHYKGHKTSLDRSLNSTPSHRNK